MSCLEGWLHAEAGVLGELATVLSDEIAGGAEAIVADLAGLADWLQVADYYYVAG